MDAKIIGCNIKFRQQIEPVHHQSRREVAVAVVAIDIAQQRGAGRHQAQSGAITQRIVPPDIQPVACVKLCCLRMPAGCHQKSQHTEPAQRRADGRVGHAELFAVSDGAF
jgi:hypothetical protein